MSLFSFFLLRLQRYAILFTMMVLVITVSFALVYRNILETENLRLEDRTRISRIKKESETLLYSSNNLNELPDEQTSSYYQELLSLSTSYLDKEYVQGKSTAVLEIELALYQTIQAGWENDLNISHFTKNEITDKLAAYAPVVSHSLTFQYLIAPKDFYLTLIQILPMSHYALLLLIACLIVWLVVIDLSRHRGLLFLNGLTPVRYARTVTLLAFLLHITLIGLQVIFLAFLSQYFHFTFQEHYPILVYSSPLSTVTAMEKLVAILLEMTGSTCLFLMLIGILTILTLKGRMKGHTPSQS